MTEKKKTSPRFEEQLAGLEEIVGRLEDESVGLEEALDLFEKGMELARSCRTRLEAVEQRVERLLADAEGQDAVTEEMDVEDGESPF